jgi:hypothetical protein
VTLRNCSNWPLLQLPVQLIELGAVGDVAAVLLQ